MLSDHIRGEEQVRTDVGFCEVIVEAQKYDMGAGFAGHHSLFVRMKVASTVTTTTTTTPYSSATAAAAATTTTTISATDMATSRR